MQKNPNDTVINDHVRRLNGFLPFDPDFAELFFENADLDSDFRIDTTVFETLEETVRDAEVKAIVLTGNAGHGKTHVCALLISEVASISLSQAQAFLKKENSHQSEVRLPDNRLLQIVKDLSDFVPDAAGEILNQALNNEGKITVVCANDGHLRESARKSGLNGLVKLLDDSVVKGRMRSEDNSVVLLNLNHQSVIAKGKERQSIFEQVFNHWVRTANKWDVCKSCPARNSCPIFHNHEFLSEKPNEKQPRFDAIETLLKIAERTGYTITIRELLLYVAYLLTGGLQCEDVQQKFKESPKNMDWQWGFLFHQTAFGERLSIDELRRHPSFSAIKKLDPGHRAIRNIDEKISDVEDYGKFSPPHLSTDDAAPKTAKERRKNALKHLIRWRAIRRSQFFEAVDKDNNPNIADQGLQVGLKNLKVFGALLDNELLPEDRKKVRDTLIKGLEAIQGIHRTGAPGELYIADQSFLRSTDTTVVGGKVSLNKIELISISEAWRRRNKQDDITSINESVNWLERGVVLSLGGVDATVDSCIELKLHEFELVMAAANGLRSEYFFAAEIRRLLNKLGNLSETSGDADRLIVFSGLSKHELIIDHETIVKAG
jgi:hypothetical protein